MEELAYTPCFFRVFGWGYIVRGGELHYRGHLAFVSCLIRFVCVHTPRSVYSRLPLEGIPLLTRAPSPARSIVWARHRTHRRQPCDSVPGHCATAAPSLNSLPKGAFCHARFTLSHVSLCVHRLLDRRPKRVRALSSPTPHALERGSLVEWCACALSQMCTMVPDVDVSDVRRVQTARETIEKEMGL